MPSTSRTAASSSLFFRQNEGAFGFAGVAQIHRHSIGGIDAKKMMNLFSKDAALELLAQQVWSKNVRNLSKKYPVFGLPFTRTPTSRSRCTQRQTVERETPISLAIRSPLMAMVALLEKSASSEVSLRSVVPGREVEAMEAGRSLLVLDGVHKQAEIGGGSGVGQCAGGKKSAPVSA